MLRERSRPSALVQLLDLFLIELTNWRWSWRAMLITDTLAPVLSTLGLGAFGRDLGPGVLAYILTGNVVVALMFGNMSKVESHVSYLRYTGALDYFATLPIDRALLIAAIVLSFLVLSLPSLLVTIALGSFFLHIPLAPSPILLLVVPLCALPLAGIGALIATFVDSPEAAGSLNLLLTLVMAGLGPVIMPPDRLPWFMVELGRLSPATYAASALRQALLGPLMPRIAIDLAVLCGFAIGIFWLVQRKMDWRQR